MIAFGFGVHLHQPIGNFDSVIESAYQTAYKPFLELIRQFPTIKINYHISGCLLEWLIAKHPEFIESLKELVKRNQVEILTSGFYEPILTFIPEPDRIDQIKFYSDYLTKLFDIEPKGLWLTERVWEQNLVKSLVKAGVKYTVLDDTHFKYSGLTEDELYGYYITEDEGLTLSVFPSSKELRYLVPFQPVAKTIQFLKDNMAKGQNRLQLLFDDGEKFGVWPGTYLHCYEKGWLKEFLQTLAETDFAQTILLSEYLESNPNWGRIYLDNSSYEEMGEWVLSAKAFTRYEKTKGKLGSNYYPLRTGFFRNFLVKYPEANRLHKRMLYISKKIAQQSANHGPHSAFGQAKIELFKGQCNDAYWHGIFGGLYLPHLRQEVYRHLLKADLLVDVNPQAAQVTDYDACGQDEVVFDTSKIFFVVAPNRGGSILCLDLKQYGINLFDIIGRHQESYHQKILTPPADTATNQKSNESVRTIHSELKLKDENVKSYLIYDNYDRLSFLDHFLSEKTTVNDFYYSRVKEIYDVMFRPRVYQYNDHKIIMHLTDFATPQSALIKSIEFNNDMSANAIMFTYALRQIPTGSVGIRFGVEFGFCPLRTLMINDKKIETKEIGEATNLRDCILEVFASNLKITLSALDSNFDLWYFPIYAISSSESGLERIYQGTVLVLSWLLFQPDANFQLELKWQIE